MFYLILRHFIVFFNFFKIRILATKHLNLLQNQLNLSNNPLIYYFSLSIEYDKLNFYDFIKSKFSKNFTRLCVISNLALLLQVFIILYSQYMQTSTIYFCKRFYYIITVYKKLLNNFYYFLINYYFIMVLLY